MIQLEFLPVLIASHRNHLRDLYDPHALPDLLPSRRARLGSLIVRVGHWMAKNRPEIATEPAAALPGASRP